MKENLQKILEFKPQLGLVLGSGLNEFAKELKDSFTIPYEQIKGLPQTTVKNHAGRFVCATIKGVRTIIAQGRVHFYEGYDMQEVTSIVNLMADAGIKICILTNAAGAINTDFAVGDFVQIYDHVCLVPNPLIGAPHFVDMNNAYDQALFTHFEQAAKTTNNTLKKGVYLQVTGPSFETPAEIRAFRAWGCDLVGMSTACECIALVKRGVKVCGISVVSNMAAGIDTAIGHGQVSQACNAVLPQFTQFLTQAIQNLEQIL